MSQSRLDNEIDLLIQGAGLLPEKYDDTGSEEFYHSPSKGGHAVYITRHDKVMDVWACECKHWQYKRTCRHIDTIIRWKTKCDRFFPTRINERGKGAWYAEYKSPSQMHIDILKLINRPMTTVDIMNAYWDDNGHPFNRGRLSELVSMGLLELKKERVRVDPAISNVVPTYEYEVKQRYTRTPKGDYVVRNEVSP